MIHPGLLLIFFTWSPQMPRPLLFSQFLGFITLGFTLSIMSPLIESIRSDIHMNYTQSGMILTGQFLGALLTVMAGGYIADRIGKKPFLIAGSIIITAGLAGCAVAPSFPVLMAACLIIGVGAGAYEVGINALMADNTESESGRTMNFLHFFFGFGAIAAPVLATFILTHGATWRTAFIFAAFLPVAYAFFLAPQKVKRGTRSVADEKSGSSMLSNKSLWLFGIVILVYVGIETSTYSWITSYWKKTGTDFPPQSAMASIFWVTLTIGRIVCGLITDRIGLIRFIAASSILTLCAGIVWTIFPYGWVTISCVFVIGFSLSGIYPTMMVISTQRIRGGTGTIVAIMTVFGSIGGFFIPMIIGRTADSHGITILPPAIAILAFIMSATINANGIFTWLKSFSSKTVEGNAEE